MSACATPWADIAVMVLGICFFIVLGILAWRR